MHLDLSEMLSTTEVQRENNITRKANKQKQKSNKELIKIVLFIKKQTVTVTFTIPRQSHLTFLNTFHRTTTLKKLRGTTGLP